MFDDPKKELVRLEELLLEEEQDEDFERFYSDLFAEFGPGTEEEDAPVAPAHNHTNNQAAAGTRPAAPAPRKNTYSDNVRPAPPVKKDRSIRNLWILAFLETAGIVALVLWWTLRIL